MFSPRNEAFNALCLFQPQILRKAVGEKIKSPACYIDGYVAPTVENWQDFFLGTDEEVADVVIGMLNPRPRLLLADPTPGTMVAVPPSEPKPQNLQITPTVDTTVSADDTNAIKVNSLIVPVDEELENIPF